MSADGRQEAGTFEHPGVGKFTLNVAQANGWADPGSQKLVANFPYPQKAG